MHNVSARTAATAATAGVCAANLWNPHASKRVEVTWYSWFKTVATADNLAIARTTARGTATTTTTPTVENTYERDVVNVAGILLDTAWSAQPTVVAAAGYLNRWRGPAADGAGFIWPFSTPFCIPPGTGLAIIAASATILQPADVTFEFAD